MGTNLYVVFEDGTLLEPIPDAIRWLQEIQLENGKWARFVEIGTNKALYYDRGRIRVDRLEDLHPERRTGYAYETNLEHRLEAASKRYKNAISMDLEGFKKKENPVFSKEEIRKRLEALSKPVREVLSSQESSGAWITPNDRFKKTMPKGVRWNGQYRVMDRISSAVFNRNVSTLCEYLELRRQLDKL